MERKFSLTLSGGAQTTVSFVKGLEELTDALSSYQDNVFCVFDENSARLLSSIPEKSIVLPSGEVNKNIGSLEKIIGKALSCGSARDTRFIGFGGGVICDMAALASSLYMRGAKLTLVPTTLLCMVDASVGGKTAIDYLGGKNLVGTFYPAQEVLISTATLETLDGKEFMCGLGEVVKHAFLTEDGSLFDFLKDNRDRIMRREGDLLEDVVYDSLRVKCSYIERDPLEKKGIRSFLNLGHTFAHALESMKGYAISHGEAVAWGVGRALEASYLIKSLDKSAYESGLSLLEDYGYDVSYRIEPSSWTLFESALGKDKKKSGGRVKFVLLEGLGKPYLSPLDEETVRSLVVEGA